MDISGFDEYIVEQIQIYDTWEEHSRCVVDLCVEKKQYHDFLERNKAGRKELCVSEKGANVFCGYINTIKSQDTYQAIHVQVEAVSFSHRMDLGINNRIFQNPSKSYDDMAAFLACDQVEIVFENIQMGQEEIPVILVQRNQTNYEFLKKLCCEKGWNMFVDTTNRFQCTIHIGNKINESKIRLTDDSIVKMEREISEKQEKLYFIAREIIKIGTEIEIQGTTAIVMSRTLLNQHEHSEFRYTAFCRREIETPECSKESYILGLAQVKQNASEDHLGKIKVEFLNYDNEMCEELIWIDYMTTLTDQEGGVVLIPDPGEIVEVMVRDKECIAVGCVRKKELEESLQNIHGRYLATRGCKIAVKDDQASVEINQHKMIITDEYFELLYGEFQMKVKDQNCIMKLGESMAIMKADAVAIRASQIQEIADCVIELKAGESEMAFQGSSIDVETKAFNVG